MAKKHFGRFLAFAAIAVSYTHLDVYKRQEKHTSNILFVVIKYIYKKPPKRIIPTKV